MLHIYCAYFVSFLAITYAGALEKSGCLEREKALALLETAEDLLSKAGNAFPSCKENLNSTNSTDCKDEKPLAYLQISKKLISDVRENFPECPKPIQKEDETTLTPIEEDDKTTPKPTEKDDKITPNPTEGDDITTPKPIEEDDKIVQNNKPNDCYDVLASGRNESGVYTIWPNAAQEKGTTLQVYCDMDTDGGGWTVIQRRGEYPVQQDFYQDWESYKNGFGNLTEEFWLGNEHIRVLCHEWCKIRFDFQDANGEKSYALYNYFVLLGSEYKLTISQYSGNAGDSMLTHHLNVFSTKDHGKTGRAAFFKSGWWHRDAGYDSNLNGIYKDVKSNVQGVFWYTWRSSLALKSVEIKVIPRKANLL